MSEHASEDDLSTYEIEDRLIASLKERDGEATAADVAADTGLPYEQVEQTLRQMLEQYKSHLDVDDEGNLRYRFDPSFPERGEQPGRWWHETKQTLWRGFVKFFKVWTMVMLVGYTIAFVLILVGLSIAALTQDEDGGGGDIAVLPFYLLARMLEFLFYIDLFSRGRFGRRAKRFRSRRNAKKPDKPFYEKIFQYLFGPDAQSSRDPLATEKAFTRFVRHRDGRVTAAEWASRSGQSLHDADNALTAGIMRFRGDVSATDDGELVYEFDDLRVTADEEEADAPSGSEPPPIWERRVKVPPLTGNPKSTNVWITIFNGFNLVASSVVLFGTVGLSTAATVGLGYIPFIFSAMFFALPAVRSLQRRWRKRRAERENERRKGLSVVFRSAMDGDVDPVDEGELPNSYADRFLVDYEGDVDVDEEGETSYVFPQIADQFEAARRAREQAKSDNVVFGQSVFSSDEEEKSLEEYEMDEFDEKLSRELGDDLSLADLEEEVAETAPAGEYVGVE